MEGVVAPDGKGSDSQGPSVNGCSLWNMEAGRCSERHDIGAAYWVRLVEDFSEEIVAGDQFHFTQPCHLDDVKHCLSLQMDAKLGLVVPWAVKAAIIKV